MSNATQLAVLDALGASQVINTLPPLGPAPASASLPVVRAPAAAAPSTAAALAFLVAKSTAGSWSGVDAVAGATPGWLLAFDLAAEPGDGAVTPLKAWPLAANEKFRLSFSTPIPLAHGLVLVFSTSGPYVKAESAIPFMSAEVT